MRHDFRLGYDEQTAHRILQKSMNVLRQVTIMKNPLWLLSLLLLATLSCSAMTRPGTRPRIVAGQRIGKVAIGLSRSRVIKELGKPTSSDKDGGYIFDSFGTPAEANVISILYERGKVIQIETIYPRFRTKEGVGRDSSWRVVNKYYGPLRVFSIGPKKEDPEHVFNYYVSSKRGIAFFMDNSGWPPVITKETGVFAVIVFRRRSGPLVSVGRSLRRLK